MPKKIIKIGPKSQIGGGVEICIWYPEAARYPVQKSWWAKLGSIPMQKNRQLMDTKFLQKATDLKIRTTPRIYHVTNLFKSVNFMIYISIGFVFKG